MSLKHAALAGAIVALCTAVDPAPLAAQTPNCVDLYRRVMAAYQTAPLSPEYNQLAAAYSATCLAGAAAAPAYPAYYPQYYPQYYAPYYQPPYYQPYYGYAEPFYPYYGVGVPVGIGLGFGRGFHHGGGFRGGGFHRGGGGGHRGGGGHHR